MNKDAFAAWHDEVIQTHAQVNAFTEGAYTRAEHADAARVRAGARAASAVDEPPPPEQEAADSDDGGGATESPRTKRHRALAEAERRIEKSHNVLIAAGRSGCPVDAPWQPLSPTFKPPSPAYRPPSPAYRPTSPAYDPTSSVPPSPDYWPPCPAYRPTSPAYDPTSSM